MSQNDAREPGQPINMTLYVDGALADALDRLAVAEQRSRSNVARLLMREALEMRAKQAEGAT